MGMVYFDPDSSERTRFEIFDDKNKKSSAASTLGTVILLIMIFSLTRAFMLKMGFGIIYIPVFDDLMHQLVGGIDNLIKLLPKN